MREVNRLRQKPALPTMGTDAGHRCGYVHAACFFKEDPLHMYGIQKGPYVNENRVILY
jgi:hypothetical protein